MIHYDYFQKTIQQTIHTHPISLQNTLKYNSTSQNITYIAELCNLNFSRMESRNLLYKILTSLNLTFFIYLQSLGSTSIL